MSSQATTPSPRRLHFKAGAQLSLLLLLALFAAVALGYTGFKLHQLNSAVADYAELAQRHQSRAEAVRRLADMESALNRFLLDGNSANLALLESDKQRIEQLAQQDEAAKNDDLLKGVLAKEQQWYTRVAQPLIEERKRLAPGQGLAEDFLNRYRASDPSAGMINFEAAGDEAYNKGRQGLMEAQKRAAYTPFLAYLIAAVLVLCLVPLTPAAFRSIHGLRKVADE